MSEPEAICQALYRTITPDTLAGRHWVINAGATREYWDDIRFLGNTATGQLGFLLAAAAATRGARVDLIAGPTSLATPTGVTRHDVTSARDMLAACEKYAADAHVFMATAAVGDFAFAERQQGKIKRGGTTDMHVRLVTNPDIVAHIAAMRGRPARVIAFAAESEHHVAHAREKMKAKGVDAMFANDISAMGSDEAGGWWLSDTSCTKIPAMQKWQLAERLSDLVECLT